MLDPSFATGLFYSDTSEISTNSALDINLTNIDSYLNQTFLINNIFDKGMGGDGWLWKKKRQWQLFTALKVALSEKSKHWNNISNNNKNHKTENMYSMLRCLGQRLSVFALGKEIADLVLPHARIRLTHSRRAASGYAAYTGAACLECVNGCNWSCNCHWHSLLERGPKTCTANTNW